MKKGTYHNDIDAKAHHVMLAEGHCQANRLRAGGYGYMTTGIGCSVGCHAMDYGLRPNDHTGLAKVLGWPEWLVHMQDRIFEELPNDERGDWHVSLAATVPVGANLARAYHRIIARMLREVSWPSTQPDDEWGCAIAVRMVAELHEQSAKSAAWPAESAAWSAARSARLAAWSAAWSAESAAWSAESAARSAESAAESAAWLAESAARSAESARSARSAAWLAAWSAAEPAWPAESAARSARSAAAWLAIRTIVLEELAYE